MPIIRIEWLPGRTAEQKRELVETLTPQFCRIAKCSPEALDWMFVDVPGENWSHGGRFLADPAPTQDT